jgi:hypothetical protein
MRPTSFGRNRVRRLETGVAWAVLLARYKLSYEADGLGQKSGLILDQSIAILNRFKTAR